MFWIVLYKTVMNNNNNKKNFINSFNISRFHKYFLSLTWMNLMETHAQLSAYEAHLVPLWMLNTFRSLCFTNEHLIVHTTCIQDFLYQNIVFFNVALRHIILDNLAITSKAQLSNLTYQTWSMCGPRAAANQLIFATLGPLFHLEKATCIV